MLGRGAAASLVLAALLGAGCIGPSDSTTVTQEPPTPAALPTNETMAPNGAGPISAFNETNKTESSGLGSMMHTHDYWGGATRKVIWQTDAGLVPLPLFPCKVPDCDSTNPTSSDHYPAGTAIADFDIPPPPEGGMVYEGTDHLEILFKNVNVPGTQVQHPYVHIGLDYLTAADEPDHFHQGPEITPGTPAIIPVTPLQADMPHQTKSLWVFRIYTKEANAFDFNVTVTAVRGNPIVNWPPHPNLYADHPTRVVFDGDVHFTSKGWAQYWIDGSDAGWTYPDRVISWGTDSVDVTVTNVQVSEQAPVPPKSFDLEYHNASYISKLGNGDPAGGRLVDTGSDGKTFHFSLTTDAQGYDTPYGQHSRWGFRFLPLWDDCASTGPVDQSLLYGCQWFPYDISYHMTIVAHGHSIDGSMMPDPNAATNSTTNGGA